MTVGPLVPVASLLAGCPVGSSEQTTVCPLHQLRIPSLEPSLCTPLTFLPCPISNDPLAGLQVWRKMEVTLWQSPNLTVMETKD